MVESDRMPTCAAIFVLLQMAVFNAFEPVNSLMQVELKIWLLLSTAFAGHAVHYQEMTFWFIYEV